MYKIILLSMLLVLVIYMLFCVLFYKKAQNNESMSSYECGFDPMSLTRLSFSYRFFLISILFIIFDVEISLMLPIPFLMMNVMSVFIFMYFIFVLLWGVLYEYYYGSLDWLDNFVSKV